jgi:hypothetical protein
MDIPRLVSMNAHWAKYPPTYKLLKIIAETQGVGFKEPEEGAADDDSADLPAGSKTIDELIVAAPPIVPGGDTRAASKAMIEAMMKAKSNG